MHRIFVRTTGSRKRDIIHFLLEQPYHLNVQHADITPFAINLMHRWVDKGDAWETREDAQDAMDAERGISEYQELTINDIINHLHYQIWMGSK